MDQDPPMRHAGRSSPESAALAPGSPIASDQSPSRSTAGYVLSNTAGSPLDPRPVPRYLPSVSLTRDLGTLETSAVPRSGASQDHLTPASHRSRYSLSARDDGQPSDVGNGYHSMLTSHQPSYSLFARDDSQPSSVGNGQASNYQLKLSETYQPGSIRKGSTSASSPAGLHPSTRGRGQLLTRGEQDSRQPGQSDLGHSRQFSPDTTSGLEEDRVVTSSWVVSSTPASTGMSIHSRRYGDAPASLDSSSTGTQEQRSTGAHSNELSFMPESATDAEQDSPRRLTAAGNILGSTRVPPSDLEQDSSGHPTVVEDNIRDSVRLSSQRGGHPTTMNAELSAVRPSRSEDVVLPSDSDLDIPEGHDFRPAQQSTELLTHGVSQSCELSQSHKPSQVDTRKDSCVSDSPVTRPGLHMRLISTSTTSTDGTDSTDSDYLSSENEYEPLSMAINSLMRQLITCLLAGWLWNLIALDFNNLVESLRKCPQGSAAGQAGKSTGKKRLMESPRQDDHSSMHRDIDNESDHEGDGQSRRRRRKIQKADNSSPTSPRLLACPFHKMYPLRFSELNEREKEYRGCSSGYWPNISRLK
jgi:hypothetical protein